jgi:succinyl-diaminopimelate desuccinylase
VPVEIDRSELVALAIDLLRFPSVNPPGGERPAAELLATRLAAAGLAVELIDHGADRASLLARLPGRGDRPAMLFTGHLDVVGAGDRPWRHDPFGGVVEGGKLYGRGASDMKGAVAAMALAAIALHRAGVPLRGDVVLAFTAGEEVDSLGAQAIVDSGLVTNVDAIVVGEPTDLELYVAEKGSLTLEIQTNGVGAHASMPHLGRNAIHAMADVVRALERHRFDVAPHPLLGEPTISVGTIRGGAGSNVVPDRCTIEVDVRTVPAQSQPAVVAELESLLHRLVRERPDLDVRITHTLGRDAVETDLDAPLVRDLAAVVADVTGRRPEPAGVVYATDAAVFVPAWAVPMVICGPGLPEQAHQTDEWLSIERLEQSARIYAALALRRQS